MPLLGHWEINDEQLVQMLRKNGVADSISPEPPAGIGE